jgi:hypothetical protein
MLAYYFEWNKKKNYYKLKDYITKAFGTFINSSQNEGLSPSCIAFRRIWLYFMAQYLVFWLLYSFHNFFFRISNFLCLSTTEDT